MKGLLLKDLYMAKKYCKSYILLVAVFILVTLYDTDSLFFLFYPCILCGMIPVNLLGYDDRSRWMQYCGTLPYTKAQIVSGKYLIGLFVQVLVLLVLGIAQAFRMVNSGIFVWEDYLVLMMMVLIVSCVASSICLPFMFKYGVEKGRIAYLVMIGAICGGSTVASGFFTPTLQTDLAPDGLMMLLCVIGIGVYALSWYLSIVFYRKREK